jgi:folate-dependent phosphoribosylglycinamide formyltransferase PurN
VATKGRDAAEVARELVGLVEAHRIDIVLLAGYLKLVPSPVVARYRGRILNIHPALLPSFGGHGMYGMRVHRAVLESGAAESGATVHFVDEEYDRGRVLAQRRVPVRAGDTPETLAARVLEVEHGLYPEAVDNLCAALVAGATPAAVLDARVLIDLD